MSKQLLWQDAKSAPFKQPVHQKGPAKGPGLIEQ
jgi:hypothetical protein